MFYFKIQETFELRGTGLASRSAAHTNQFTAPYAMHQTLVLVLLEVTKFTNPAQRGKDHFNSQRDMPQNYLSLVSGICMEEAVAERTLEGFEPKGSGNTLERR